MHEHIAPAVYYFEVHLLCASIACLAAYVLTSVWRGAASVKYWIWVATSLNFLIPLGGFFNRFGASRIPWATQQTGDIGFAFGPGPRFFAGRYNGAKKFRARTGADFEVERRTASGRNLGRKSGGRRNSKS